MIDWTGTTNKSAEDAFAGDGKAYSGPTVKAMQWLKEFLADGPKSVTDIETGAAMRSFSDYAVKQAKAALRIEAKKSGFDGGWQWHLPNFDIA
jgi:hypothetical protein